MAPCLTTTGCFCLPQRWFCVIVGTLHMVVITLYELYDNGVLRLWFLFIMFNVTTAVCLCLVVGALFKQACMVLISVIYLVFLMVSIPIIILMIEMPVNYIILITVYCVCLPIYLYFLRILVSYYVELNK